MKKTNIINGDVTFNPKDDYSDVEEITGSLDCRGAGTRAAFPKLSTVGGWLDCRGAGTRAAFPKLKNKEVGDSAARNVVARTFRRKGFLFADGLLSRIVETKQSRGGAQIHKIVAVGQNKTSYCIELDGTYSHGDTIKEARESLIYKVGKRDKSAYVGWKLDRKISAKEAIKSYRVITGACEAGVRGFVQSHGKLKRTYTVQEVIDLTKGQFGNDAYAAFFKDSGNGDAKK